MKLAIQNKINVPIELEIQIPPAIMNSIRLAPIVGVRFLFYEKGKTGKIVTPPGLTGIGNLELFKVHY
jgi:hypothetical protein